MSIVTFANLSQYETGQTMMAAAVACCLGIEHNYKTLLLTTDFNDKTLENCFWNGYQKERFANILTRGTNISNDTGVEGLLRAFNSNHATGDAIASYAKPVLKDRLDLIPAPKTHDFKEFVNISNLFSQICTVGQTHYDVIIVDLYRNLPEPLKKKIMDMSMLTLVGLKQNYGSIKEFDDLRKSNEYFATNKIGCYISRYDMNSKFSQKNVERFLGSKVSPYLLNYSSLFTDRASEGEILDYILQARTLTNEESPDFQFYKTLKETTDRIDTTRRDIEFRRI